MQVKELLKEFETLFGNDAGAKAYFAPGRVNLIGEHIDYNGGHVFPLAIHRGTYAVARKRSDDKLRLYSMNFEEIGICERSLKELFTEDKNWTMYPCGVIASLLDKGYQIPCGIDIMFYGDIPNGSGLSSSASIEVLTGYICMELFGLDYDMKDLSLICQESEQKYNGVNCGIMDQFSIAMGRKHKAVVLDTGSLKHQYVDFSLGDYALVVMNTNKKRGLADSKYNERRSECQTALSMINKKYSYENLCEISMEDWDQVSASIEDETVKKRAKHTVTEEYRVKKAVEALEHEDYELLGTLLNESHDSLSKDYEVTGVELDTIVNEARTFPGVLGARMTGAGFGGCAIAIVPAGSVEEFTKAVGEAYEKKIGYSADFYFVKTGGGPRIL